MANNLNNMITIKKIKDLIILGTDVKYFQAEFVKEIFVEKGCFLSETKFEEIITKNTNTFGLFVREGNLRKTKNSYSYAIPKITEYFERLINESNFEDILNTFEYVYQQILENVYNNIHGIKSYNQGLYNRIIKAISKENTYYIELYSELLNYDQNSICKILSLLTLIAIFQDNIIKISPQNRYKTKWSEQGFFPHNGKDSITSKVYNNKELIPDNIDDIFKMVLHDNQINITEIDMAFHSGFSWRNDTEKIALLCKAIENNIKIRILINQSKTVNNICTHMRYPLKFYPKFDNVAMEWIKLAQRHPNQIFIRIANIPILHKIYILKGKNNFGWVNVEDYIYGNYTLEKLSRNYCANSCIAYQTYVNEFEYIWSSASLICSEELLSNGSETPSVFVSQTETQISTEQYFNLIENNILDVSLFEIAYHTGDSWLAPHSQKFSLIKKMCDRKIPIRILINTSEAAETLWKHMRDKDAYKIGLYKKFEDIILAWRNFERTYSNVCVRISNKPFLHNYIHCECNSDTTIPLRIRLYEYNEYKKKLPQIHFYINSNDPEAIALKTEFSYLWNDSE